MKYIQNKLCRSHRELTASHYFESPTLDDPIFQDRIWIHCMTWSTISHAEKKTTDAYTTRTFFMHIHPIDKGWVVLWNTIASSLKLFLYNHNKFEPCLHHRFSSSSTTESIRPPRVYPLFREVSMGSLCAAVRKNKNKNNVYFIYTLFYKLSYVYEVLPKNCVNTDWYFMNIL